MPTKRKKTKKATDQMNIYEKLAAMREEMEVIAKNRSGYGYCYVSEDEIQVYLTGALERYNMLLMPDLVIDQLNHEVLDYQTTKKGSTSTVHEILIYGPMLYRWVNVDNNEEQIVSHWYFFGTQSDAAQAFGSGLTYANRYYLMKFFNIATPEGDPDNWLSKKQEASDREEKELIRELQDEINKLLGEYIARFEPNTPEYKQAIDATAGVIKKTVRDSKGRPSSKIADVTSAEVAEKLLEALNAYFKESAESKPAQPESPAPAEEKKQAPKPKESTERKE